MLFNLRAVDLNLLPVFEAAYEERNLSRAAARLAMTQPAVSHALARLRAAFRDELFVRHARGMTPTAAADALYGRVGEALGLVRAAVAESRGFDPATATRRFAVAIPHPAGPLIAVRLLETLRLAAPGVTLAVDTRSRPHDLDRALADGQVDAAVDWLVPRAAGIAREPLFEDGVVAVAREGHPAVRADRRWADLARRRDLVRLRPRAAQETHPLAALRELQRLGATAALEVSEALEVLVVASRSDLVGIAPASVARPAARPLGLRVLTLSPDFPSEPVHVLFRANRQADPALAFLRESLRRAAAQALSAKASGRR